MTYDPNYNYDEDDGLGSPNVEDDEDDEENDEYSDDDDMSWKVRRSAAKSLEAIISTRHELLAEFYKVLSPALISRFKGNYPAPFNLTVCLLFNLVSRTRRKREI